MTTIGQQLAGFQSASMIKEMTFFRQEYTLVLPNGVRTTASGWTHLCFEDNYGEPVLDIRYNPKFFGLPDMEVRFGDFPTLKLRLKNTFSRSVLILNESGELVLRVKRSFFTAYDKIIDVYGVEVGRIYTGCSERDVHFPRGLHVKYKAALLAACVFMTRRVADFPRQYWCL
ncbi:hypothetical protein NE865_10549 [Phthorimaea operculella]|nr:hypothetical protein NE865_10549 [Phthorimaea operculella]